MGILLEYVFLCMVSLPLMARVSDLKVKSICGRQSSCDLVLTDAFLQFCRNSYSCALVPAVNLSPLILGKSFHIFTVITKQDSDVDI